MAETFMGRPVTRHSPPRLGSGARFSRLSAQLAAAGNVENPDSVAAAIGRKKYGKARFQKLAARGR